MCESDRGSLEVLGDDLELLLDDSVHDANDGVVGGRVLAAEVPCVLRHGRHGAW